MFTDSGHNVKSVDKEEKENRADSAVHFKTFMNTKNAR
jgi:hypothetical protein